MSAPAEERKEARAAARRDAVAPGASASSLGGTGSRSGAQPAPRPAKASRGGDDDFSDIEAILKKHGI